MDALVSGGLIFGDKALSDLQFEIGGFCFRVGLYLISRDERILEDIKSEL